MPDNQRAGVLRANCYEPGINPAYRDLAAHYGTAILPTRVRKPRDKAKVEIGVLVVERWILARLRHQRFFSLTALNEASARGRDAVDVPISNTFGPHSLVGFKVWTDKMAVASDLPPPG